MNVVLLDADPSSRRMEVAALRYGGNEVTTVLTVEQAVTNLRAHRADAVVVDPVRSEVTRVVAVLRSRTELPIIVVSDAGGGSEEVAALDAGADDYVTKPFGVEVFLARLRAVVRRVRRSQSVTPFVTDDFIIDVEARRVFRTDGTEVLLTGIEFRLVEILLRHPGHLVPRQKIMEEIWGTPATRSPNHLRVFVARIRQKLEPDPAHPRYLLTANGLGLVFEIGAGHSQQGSSSGDLSHYE